MPFRTMQLITYEARLKKYIVDGRTLTMNQLKSAFKNDKEWRDALNDETSNLVLLINGYFKYGDGNHKNENDETVYDFTQLLIYGLLLCPTNDQSERNNIFY